MELIFIIRGFQWNRGFNQFWGYYAIIDDLNNDRFITKEQYISLEDENLKGRSLGKDERTKKKMP